MIGGHGKYNTNYDVNNTKAHYDAGITTLDTSNIYGSSEITDRVVEVNIHREERTKESPSDHVPVSVEIDNLGGDDDRPMVF